MTYRNVGTQPLRLPDGFVLGPGDAYTGELPEDLVAWFVAIGAIALEPPTSEDSAAPLDDVEEEG